MGKSLQGDQDTSERNACPECLSLYSHKPITTLDLVSTYKPPSLKHKNTHSCQLTMAAKKLICSFSSMFIKSPSLFSFSSSSSASRHRPISAFSSLNPGLGSPGRSSFSASPSNPDYDPRAGAQILEGCDYQHWFVVVDKPDEGTLREDIIADYIRILATVVGRYVNVTSYSCPHFFFGY